MSQNHTSAGVLILQHQWKKRLSSDNFDDSLLADLQMASIEHQLFCLETGSLD